MRWLGLRLSALLMRWSAKLLEWSERTNTWAIALEDRYLKTGVKYVEVEHARLYDKYREAALMMPGAFGEEPMTVQLVDMSGDSEVLTEEAAAMLAPPPEPPAAPAEAEPLVGSLEWRMRQRVGGPR